MQEIAGYKSLKFRFIELFVYAVIARPVRTLVVAISIVRAKIPLFSEVFSSGPGDCHVASLLAMTVRRQLHKPELTDRSVILSERSESKDLRIIVAFQ